TRFKETEREVLQGHLDLLGERVWSHTIVLFTCGDSLSDTSIEHHIESEGQDLQRLLDKCGNRYHVLNNQNRSDHTQIKELLEKIEETVAQNNGCHFEIDRKILLEMKERRRAEEERAREPMKRMKKQKDNIRSQMKQTALRILLSGERVWSHTIVLVTRGDSLSDTSIEQYIESEGQNLQRLLDKCGNRYHVLNNQNRSDHTQIKELLEKIEETVAQNNGCHFEIDRKILQEMKERRRAEEERARERMKRMKKQKDNIRSQMSEYRIYFYETRDTTTAQKSK
ncbi:hypothetical protein cypCar_00049853, partial [Cyprinus carpio]